MNELVDRIRHAADQAGEEHVLELLRWHRVVQAPEPDWGTRCPRPRPPNTSAACKRAETGKTTELRAEEPGNSGVGDRHTELDGAATDDGQTARLAQAVGERDNAVRRLAELEAAYARGEVGLDTLTRTPTVIDEMIAVAEERIAALTEAAHASPPWHYPTSRTSGPGWLHSATLEQQRLILGDLVAIHIGPCQAATQAQRPAGRFCPATCSPVPCRFILALNPPLSVPCRAPGRSRRSTSLLYDGLAVCRTRVRTEYLVNELRRCPGDQQR